MKVLMLLICMMAEDRKLQMFQLDLTNYRFLSNLNISTQGSRNEIFLCQPMATYSFFTAIQNLDLAVVIFLNEFLFCQLTNQKNTEQKFMDHVRQNEILPYCGPVFHSACHGSLRKMKIANTKAEVLKGL